MAQTISSYLEVDEKSFSQKDVLDSVIGVDTHLFLDPWLLRSTNIPEFKDSYEKIKKYFTDIITLLSVSTKVDDRAWKEAYIRLIFKEVQGVSIGYGVHSSDGNAIGPMLARKLVNSASEIINLGIKDPEIFELLGLFEEDFGADRLSDMTISIIKEDVYNFTERISKELGIRKTQKFTFKGKDIHLPKHPTKNKPLIFLPNEFLRDLPVALTWEGIDYVVAVNQELRNRLNQLIGHTWKNKITKKQLRDLIFTDRKNIEDLIATYRGSKQAGYDFVKDPTGEATWYRTGKQFADRNPLTISPSDVKTIEDLESVVQALISQFRKNVEVNGLKELLYVKEKFRYTLRHERYSQLIFYSAADSYCNANNLDLSREPNAGNGPVDFKLSSGYKARFLVEIKLSSNKRLIHGYTKQLPAYEAGEDTDRSAYVIIRVTKSDNQIKEVLKLREAQVKKGVRAPEVFVIDGRLLPSASRR